MGLECGRQAAKERGKGAPTQKETKTRGKLFKSREELSRSRLIL